MWLPLLLVTSLAIVYAPSLGAGYLNYDDPWLLSENPLFASKQPLSAVLYAICCDLSRPTRMALGAEYLPLRDLLGLLETRVLALAPEQMHAVSLALYTGAVLMLRAALRRTLGPTLTVELAVLLFALHPVHAESVAWLAGQKDVLALLFVCVALYVQALGRPHARVLVPLLLLAATLSKSMSVIAIVLLAAQDFVRHRRLDLRLYGASLVAVSLSLCVHLQVGASVNMFAEHAGGSRYSALLTMGPVWLRYLRSCLLPTELSVAYDVPTRVHWDMQVLSGYAFVLGSLALSTLGLLLSRRGGQPLAAEPVWWRGAAFLFIWFFVPLLPVSQVLIPLQHQMADRYLWLSALAPCLLVAYGLRWCAGLLSLPARRRVFLFAGLAMLLPAGAATFRRSLVFSDSVLLFADATRKTKQNSDAPYQLGKALEESGREDEALLAFAEVLRRTADSPGQAVARRATNNYARLLVRRGEFSPAERALRHALQHFPHDPKLTSNLAKVLRAMERSQENDAFERGLRTLDDVQHEPSERRD